MKIKIALSVLALSVLFMASAQAKPKDEAPSKPITVDDIVAKMTKQLELTDQQAQAVKPIVANYLAQEKQLKLEEKDQLSHVLTSQQLYTWNFLQNETPHDKRKHSSLF